MLPEKNKTEKENNDIKPNEQEISDKRDRDKDVKAALEQAEQDIDDDADISFRNPNDDLDEGESARLGEDKNDLT
jgi:hypothetical protein